MLRFSFQLAIMMGISGLTWAQLGVGHPLDAGTPAEKALKACKKVMRSLKLSPQEKEYAAKNCDYRSHYDDLSLGTNILLKSQQSGFAECVHKLIVLHQEEEGVRDLADTLNECSNINSDVIAASQYRSFHDCVDTRVKASFHYSGHYTRSVDEAVFGIGGDDNCLADKVKPDRVYKKAQAPLDSAVPAKSAAPSTAITAPAQ